MTKLKHFDFQVPGWGEFQQGPQQKLGYRSEVLADSPLIFLRLGEPSGPTALDEIGFHNAAEVGAMNWGLPGSLRYDTDTAVGSPATGGLSVNSTGWLPVGSDARTVELWFRPNVSTASNLGITYGSGQSDTITFVYSSGGLLVTVNWNSFGGATASLSDQWHHAAFVFPDGASQIDEFTIYLDGVSIATQMFSGSGATLINTNDSALLLNMSGVGFYHNCEIDEVAIYGAALSAQRIQEHYDAAVGRVGQ